MAILSQAIITIFNKTAIMAILLKKWGRKMELRPTDYDIHDTREVSKLKVIDIFRNLKIMSMEDFIHLGLINLNFLSYKRLIRDIKSNIGIGKKYHGVPNLV